MINITQVAVLWFNDDTDNLVSIVDFAINVNTADRFVSVDFTGECSYNDETTVFNFFLQRQSGDINMTIKDNALGTRRTIKFEKAQISSYLETYNSQQLSAENRNAYFIEFSIHADTVNLGNSSFSPSA
jgi:hypothetical protein